MTSDEKNETWWDDVKARGWAKMDHEELRTVERYGRWYALLTLSHPSHFRRGADRLCYRYPVILDAAIQSNGLGFVGTDLSTFSILSKRRVLDWHGGAARMVKWGFKEADAHRKRMLSDTTQ